MLGVVVGKPPNGCFRDLPTSCSTSREEGLYLVNGEPALLSGMSFDTDGIPLVLVITDLDKQQRVVPQSGDRVVLVGRVAASHTCVSANCAEFLEWAWQ